MSTHEADSSRQAAMLMNTKTRLAVLTDTEFLLVGTTAGKRAVQSIPVGQETIDLGTLFLQAVQAGLSSVWVMPETRLSREVRGSLLEQADSVWEVEASTSPLDPTRPVCAQLFRKVGAGRQGPLLALTFPEYGGWGWHLPDATTLLATVTYLEQVLGVPVACSPERLAADLLTGSTATLDTAWMRPPNVDLRTLSTRDEHTVPILESAQSVAWRRPLTIAEWRMKYLHKYEDAALDLEGCTTVLLGAGDPRYSGNGRAYDGKMPGIWRVKAETAGSVFDGKRLPSCLHGEWMSTPEVKCCTTIAYQVQVTEGYYWPESHRTMEPWASTLWKARQRLTPRSTTDRRSRGRANALHTIDAITQLGIEQLLDEKGPLGRSRPDWWAQIVGQRRASVFAHLVTLVRRGFMPVLVDGQAFWLVSNDPNPLSALAGLLTHAQPGGYTAAYETPLTLSNDIKEAFRAATSTEQLVMLLDSLARQEDKQS